MIERDFDVALISNLALREKQIQQRYRPVIAVHKWFARRPGTVFRGLLLSELTDGPLAESFYRSHDLTGRRVADPFMGGGTPLLEANRVGCDVVGRDINPMAWWVVRQEIRHLDLEGYRRAADGLRRSLERDIGHLYRTTCAVCGSDRAKVKYFLWIKTRDCAACGAEIRLFPGYLVSHNRRHPRFVFLCPACGDLSEREDRDRPGHCDSCGATLTAGGPARRGKCPCPRCGEIHRFPTPGDGPPRHALFALEYVCPVCRPTHAGRFFKRPDNGDRDRLAEAERRWAGMTARFVPEDEIPPGDETDRLHRWGYRRSREMFNPRQSIALEAACRIIDGEADERIRDALATNLSDLLRYQNMLCRYDAAVLKSLDIFSVHGFPVGLIQCESNILGIRGLTGKPVGSGGWLNIIEKTILAKAFCQTPFEYRIDGRKKVRVDLPDEWIGDRREDLFRVGRRGVDLHCGDAVELDLPAESLDAVLTDPPYFGNVQYAELMDFCYVWLRKLVGGTLPTFSVPSTRNAGELTGNVSMKRDLAHFAGGLSQVFSRMAVALKPGAPLAFTYHHNRLDAYLPVAVAVLDAGLTVSAALHCPGEMGASIHISGTGSSIIDTIFVCRTEGRIPRKWIVETPAGVDQLVGADVRALSAGGVRPTAGDLRCIGYGHLIRLAVWFLRGDWRREMAIGEKLDRVRGWLDGFGRPVAVADPAAAIVNDEPAGADDGRWVAFTTAGPERRSDNRPPCAKPRGGYVETMDMDGRMHPASGLSIR